MLDAATGRRARSLPYVLGALTGLVVGLTVLLVLVSMGRLGRPPAARPDAGAVDPLGASRRNAIVRAVESTQRSVVTIVVVGPQKGPTVVERLFWYPFDVQRPNQWIGSGFLVDEGYVLTNEHVVHDAIEIVVSAGDERGGLSLPGTVVGRAPEYDLALLRIPATRDSLVKLGVADTLLVPARLGDSDDLMVGEWAIAIGSPFGQELGNYAPSVSVGVISAVQRDVPPLFPARPVVTPYLKMIQTDAAIDEGNSGGPLVNAAGEVIGVNTVKLAGSVGVNFSIPINTVKWVWQELRDYGQVRKPWLGWTLEEMPLRVRRELRIREEDGVLTVAATDSGGPAHAAGIRPGDIVHTIQGLPAYSLARCERILFGTPIGLRVEVEVLRDGHLHRLLVQMDEDPTSRAEREARARQRLG